MYFWRNWNKLVYTVLDLFSEFILTGPFWEIEIVDHVCKMNRSLKMLTFSEIEYLRIGIHQKSPVTCSTTVQIGIISSFDLKCRFIVDLLYQKIVVLSLEYVMTKEIGYHIVFAYVFNSPNWLFCQTQIYQPIT